MKNKLHYPTSPKMTKHFFFFLVFAEAAFTAGFFSFWTGLDQKKKFKKDIFPSWFKKKKIMYMETN